MKHYMVKGSSLQSKLDYVAANWGADAAKALRLTVETQLDGPLLASGWYHYGAFVALLERIVRERLNGDTSRLREIGRDSASKALTGTYKVFSRGEDFRGFLDGLSRLHGNFYDQGMMEVLGTGDRACEIVLSGAPSYERSDMEVAAGFYLGAAEHFGHPLNDCSIAIAGGKARFSLSW